MTRAFLLRYQEPCINTAIGPVCTGTETHTYVRAEQVDADPRHHSFRAVPHRTEHISTASAGTKTVTEIRQEADDNDPVSRRFETIPKEEAR